MPAEIRTRLSVRPIAARRSGGTDACVIVAGCEISVSTPPRLSASAMQPDARCSTPPRRLERCRRRTTASRRSRASAASRARAADGSAAPGRAPCCTFGCAARNSRERQAVGVVLRHPHRAASWCRAAPATNRTGSRIAPAAFWMNRSHSMSSSRTATTMPPTLSLWPFRYFVVLWTTRSAPNSIGRCTYGLANVLSTTSRTSWRCASSAAAARSVSRITGLVGVSTNSIFVAGVIARSISVEAATCRRS